MRVVVDNDHFEYSSGWIIPNTRGVRFTDLSSITARRLTINGKTHIDYECHKKSGGHEDFTSTVLMSKAFPHIVAKAQKKGVPIHIDDNGVPIYLTLAPSTPPQASCSAVRRRLAARPESPARLRQRDPRPFHPAPSIVQGRAILPAFPEEQQVVPGVRQADFAGKSKGQGFQTAHAGVEVVKGDGHGGGGEGAGMEPV
jgi:hypothetical protein